jgi:hypothetical protein
MRAQRGHGVGKPGLPDHKRSTMVSLSRIRSAFVCATGQAARSSKPSTKIRRENASVAAQA